MKIDDDEYTKLLKEHIKEELRLHEEPKPSGVMGMWGFHAVKAREFKEMMIKEGRVSRDNPRNPKLP
jgi:hypothetical protein